jgi:hypothetical protein
MFHDMYDAAPVRERNVVRQPIDRSTLHWRSLVTWRGLISQNERLWNGRCWRAKWTIVVWDQKPAVVVHRHGLHVRHRFGAADPGPVIRRALLDIWAIKSSILERRSLRIGEVFALL